MIWSALLKDGRRILEFDNGVETTFDKLNQSEIKSFRLYEDVELTNVSFSATTGLVRFQEFDLQKLKDLPDGYQFNILYNKERQCFELSKDSLSMYNRMLLRDNVFHNFIEIEEDGVINLNGEKFYLSFKDDEGTTDLVDNSPFNSIIQYKEASTDFSGGAVGVRKRVDRVTAHVIGYTKNLRHMQTQINLSLKIIYSIANKCITFMGIINCDKTLKGQLDLIYGNKVSSLSTTFLKDTPTKVERVITLL